MKKCFQSQFVKMLLMSLAAISFVACNQNKDEGKGIPAPQNNPPTNPQKINVSSSAATTPKTHSITFAQDNIVQTLAQELNNIEDQDLKHRNEVAAASIVSIDSKVNSENNSLRISVKLKDDKNNILEEVLLGKISNQSRKTSLTNNSDKGLLKGTFTCFDTDFPRYCTTAILELRSTNEKDAVSVKAVIRKTIATASLPMQNSYDQTSAEYKTLLKLFQANNQADKTADEVSEIQVASTEVINGITTVQIQILTKEKQVIGVEGPLKQVVNSNIVESDLVKKISPLALRDLISEKEIKTDIQNSLLGAQIIQVLNGTSLSLLLDAKGSSKNSRQTVRVLIQREFPTLIQL